MKFLKAVLQIGGMNLVEKIAWLDDLDLIRQAIRKDAAQNDPDMKDVTDIALDTALQCLEPFDPIQFILAELPLWVEYDGYIFTFQAFHNGSEFRIGYLPGLGSELPPTGWFNPILNKWCSFLYLDESPEDLPSFLAALLECKEFLDRNESLLR